MGRVGGFRPEKGPRKSRRGKTEVWYQSEFGTNNSPIWGRGSWGKKEGGDERGEKGKTEKEEKGGKCLGVILSYSVLS